MRLVCPSCDAQYEVGDDAIPESGRDVQCSNCGQTWFQPHGDAEGVSDETFADVASEEPDAGAPEAAPEDAPAEETPYEEEAAPEHVAEAPAADEVAAEAVSEETFEEPAPEEVLADEDSTRPQSAVDEEVAAILQEEAAIEQDARSGERGGGLETQPDLGIDAAAGAGGAFGGVRERIARLRGTAPEAAQDAAARGDTLPDIDEINSTLTATSDHGDDADHPPQARRRGFRKGFSLAIVLVALAFFVHQFSPQIAERVPAAKPALDTYGAWVQEARAMIDRSAKSATDRITGIIEGMNSGE